MSEKRWHLLMVLTLMIGLVWIAVNRVPVEAIPVTSDLPPAPAIGHPAPDFTLTTLDGEIFTLSEVRGKPVVLNFWATWCPPCRAELPVLQAAHVRLAGQVEIVGVDQLEPVALVEPFVASQGLSFVIPLDTDAAVSRLYRVRSLPTTFFIDRAGIIRQIQVGPVTEATLQQMLKTVYP